jgi:hypothetical protein
MNIHAGGEGIGCDEGVEEQSASPYLNRETRMTIVSEIHRHDSSSGYVLDAIKSIGRGTPCEPPGGQGTARPTLKLTDDFNRILMFFLYPRNWGQLSETIMFGWRRNPLSTEPKTSMKDHAIIAWAKRTKAKRPNKNPTNLGA